MAIQKTYISHKLCKRSRVKTMGFTGYYGGGKLKKLADYSVNVNINDMQISENIHMVLDHLVMRVMTDGIRKQDGGFKR